MFEYSEYEQETMDNLVKAWDYFIKMYDSWYNNENELDAKSCHPDDIKEFRHGIHFLQHIIAAKAMRRVDPKNWLHYPLMVQTKQEEL